MQVHVGTLARGVATLLPFVGKLACQGTGGTSSARYCYSVWLRHLARACEAGHRFAGTGGSIAELGPGDSLGIGLASLLSGLNTYMALDAKAHASAYRNTSILEELVDLFRGQTPIPGDEEFPLVFPKLRDYGFPSHLLNAELLSMVTSPRRVASIVRALQEPGQRVEGIQIMYVAPWFDTSRLARQSVDLVLSQAVLEHVDDIERAHGALHYWLRPGGFASHTIDYKCHGLTKDWSGHWTVSDRLWRLVRGRRPYLINRHPHSFHTKALREAGFRICLEERFAGDPMNRANLATRFTNLLDSDLATAGAYIQATKNS